MGTLWHIIWNNRGRIEIRPSSCRGKPQRSRLILRETQLHFRLRKLSIRLSKKWLIFCRRSRRVRIETRQGIRIRYRTFYQRRLLLPTSSLQTILATWSTFTKCWASASVRAGEPDSRRNCSSRRNWKRQSWFRRSRWIGSRSSSSRSYNLEQVLSSLRQGNRTHTMRKLGSHPYQHLWTRATATIYRKTPAWWIRCSSMHSSIRQKCCTQLISLKILSDFLWRICAQQSQQLSSNDSTKCKWRTRSTKSTWPRNAWTNRTAMKFHSIPIRRTPITCSIV